MHYPADTQECDYHLRSYSYKEDLFRVQWKGVGVYLDDPKDPNFDVRVDAVEPGNELKGLQIEELFDEHRRGNYSALRFSIKIRRKISYHIVQTYIPSTILILITWLCFILPSEMIDARIGISMTTLLTLMALFSAVRQQSPAVAYSMSIDYWMVYCIFSIFFALLLFALVYWINVRINKESSTQMRVPQTQSEINFAKLYAPIMTLTKRFGFKSFALCFITFSVVYWGLLLLRSNYLDWAPNPKYNGELSEGDDPPNNLYKFHEIKMEEQEFPDLEINTVSLEAEEDVPFSELGSGWNFKGSRPIIESDEPVNFDAKFRAFSPVLRKLSPEQSQPPVEQKNVNYDLKTINAIYKQNVNSRVG